MKSRKLLITVTFLLLVVFAVGTAVFASNSNDMDNTMMQGKGMSEMMQMMDDKNMQKMMDGMNSPEGKEMMNSCVKFMESSNGQEK